MKKIINNEIVNFSEKFNCHHNLIQFYSNIYLNMSQLKNKIKLHSLYIFLFNFNCDRISSKNTYSKQNFLNFHFQ